jgi:hypothetical protein
MAMKLVCSKFHRTLFTVRRKRARRRRRKEVGEDVEKCVRRVRGIKSKIKDEELRGARTLRFITAFTTARHRSLS